MIFGGVFIFGDGQTRTGAIINLVFGLINLGGGIAVLSFGLANNVLGLKLFGVVLCLVGVLMILFSLIGFRNRRRKANQAENNTIQFEN